MCINIRLRGFELRPRPSSPALSEASTVEYDAYDHESLKSGFEKDSDFQSNPQTSFENSHEVEDLHSTDTKDFDLEECRLPQRKYSYKHSESECSEMFNNWSREYFLSQNEGSFYKSNRREHTEPSKTKTENKITIQGVNYLKVAKLHSSSEWYRSAPMIGWVRCNSPEKTPLSSNEPSSATFRITKVVSISLNNIEVVCEDAKGNTFRAEVELNRNEDTCASLKYDEIAQLTIRDVKFFKFRPMIGWTRCSSPVDLSKYNNFSELFEKR